MAANKRATGTTGLGGFTLSEPTQSSKGCQVATASTAPTHVIWGQTVQHALHHFLRHVQLGFAHLCRLMQTQQLSASISGMPRQQPGRAWQAASSMRASGCPHAAAAVPPGAPARPAAALTPIWQPVLLAAGRVVEILIKAPCRGLCKRGLGAHHACLSIHGQAACAAGEASFRTHHPMAPSERWTPACQK